MTEADSYPLQAQVDVAWSFADTMARYGRYPDVRNWGTRLLQALTDARDSSSSAQTTKPAAPAPSLPTPAAGLDHPSGEPPPSVGDSTTDGGGSWPGVSLQDGRDPTPPTMWRQTGYAL
jgi:hypothetical protein